MSGTAWLQLAALLVLLADSFDFIHLPNNEVSMVITANEMFPGLPPRVRNRYRRLQ